MRGRIMTMVILGEKSTGSEELVSPSKGENSVGIQRIGLAPKG
jgi:hypothetical protein